MKIQKTPNSQSNLEKEKQSWRNQMPWLQTILQSCSHQNSMVLAQKQKYRSMEQDRKPRNETIHLCSINLWQRRHDCRIMETVSSINIANICANRASLVAQWLRICLPMQGTRVPALLWEDPTCRGATRPVSHNYWACASGACAPQQERPR